MKLLALLFLVIMATGCASTMEQANIECSRGRIASFQDGDFTMNCQEHSIKEYRGLPQPQTQVIVVQQPVQTQPQVVYIPQPQAVVQVPQANPNVGYKIDQGGPGSGGRQIISRVKR